MKNYFFLISLLITSLLGCAPKANLPFYLDIKRLDNVNRIVFHIHQASPELQVFDANIGKNTMSQTYRGTINGAIGAAVEGLILEGIAHYKVNKAIGGDLDQLEKHIDSKKYDDIFKKVLQESISVQNSQSRNFEIVYIDEVKSNSIFPQQEILQEYEADIFVDIAYVYGFGIQEHANPNTMIRAKLHVIDLRDNTIIVFRNMTSGYSYSGSKFNQYIANNGALFEKEYIDAAGKIAKSVANILYLE